MELLGFFFLVHHMMLVVQHLLALIIQPRKKVNSRRTSEFQTLCINTKTLKPYYFTISSPHIAHATINQKTWVSWQSYRLAG